MSAGNRPGGICIASVQFLERIHGASMVVFKCTCGAKVMGKPGEGIDQWIDQHTGGL